MCFPSSQIVGFFDCQYVGVETTTFGWVKSGLPLVQSDCKITSSSKSLRIINWYLYFLHRYNYPGMVASETITLVGGYSQSASILTRLQNSLINNISDKNLLKFQFFMRGVVGYQGTVVSDGCTKFFLCSNKIARLFYHQIIWKKSIGILVFYTRSYSSRGNSIWDWVIEWLSNSLIISISSWN